jgi:phosphate transport system substrate-binding protein
MVSTAKRLGALAFTAALLVGACSSSGGGSSTAPSAAAPSAAAPSVAAPSVAASSAPSAAASGAASAAASQGAAPSNSATCTAGSITAGGSTALQPVVEKAAKDYGALCPGSTISVQGGGSGTGLSQVAAGTFNIGNSDITVQESKLDATQQASLVNHNIALQGWIMINNPSITGVTNLTTQQATDIWTGKITNWKDVGGPDQAIVLVLRPASSGTRAKFKKIVLGGKDEAQGQALTEDSSGAVAQAVKSTPGSTSVVGFAYYQANKAGLTGLQLDGVDATVDNMTNGTYKLKDVGHSYTKGEATGLTQSFIQYLLSPYVQQVTLPSLYYAPAPAQ